MDLLQRIERLERQNSRCRWACLVMLVFCAGLLLTSRNVQSQARADGEGIKEIVATKFILKDAKGKIRGEWGCDNNFANGGERTYFDLRTTKGNVGAGLSANAFDKPGHDKHSEASFWLTGQRKQYAGCMVRDDVIADKKVSQACFAVRDATNELRVKLGTVQDETKISKGKDAAGLLVRGHDRDSRVVSILPEAEGIIALSLGTDHFGNMTEGSVLMPGGSKDGGKELFEVEEYYAGSTLSLLSGEGLHIRSFPGGHNKGRLPPK